MTTTPLKPTLFLGAAALLVAGIAVPNGWAGHHEEEMPFSVAEILIQLNDTDGDLGFHARIDGEPWKELEIEAPNGDAPASVEDIKKQGVNFWPLAVIRAMDDALLHLRFNEPTLGTLIIKTSGDGSQIAAYDALLDQNRDDWLVREIVRAGRGRGRGLRAGSKFAEHFKGYDRVILRRQNNRRNMDAVQHRSRTAILVVLPRTAIPPNGSRELVVPMNHPSRQGIHLVVDQVFNDPAPKRKLGSKSPDEIRFVKPIGAFS